MYCCSERRPDAVNIEDSSLAVGARVHASVHVSVDGLGVGQGVNLGVSLVISLVAEFSKKQRASLTQPQQTPPGHAHTPQTTYSNIFCSIICFLALLQSVGRGLYGKPHFKG